MNERDVQDMQLTRDLTAAATSGFLASLPPPHDPGMSSNVSESHNLGMSRDVSVSHNPECLTMLVHHTSPGSRRFWHE